jgi:hypothetical protein
VSDIQNPAEVVGKRKNILKDDPSQDIVVTASLRDQQLDKLVTKLEDLNMGEKISQMWHTGQMDRSEWLTRQSAFLTEIDEFINPIYSPALDWSSTLHLPTILTVCKTYHSRMFAALWGIDPPFVCRSRTAANSDRAMLVEDLMRYTLRDWCNEYDGVEETLDKWLWDWITKGDGYLKARWSKQFTRFQDIETTHVEDVKLEMDPQTGASVPTPFMREVEREVSRTEEIYNGPMLERTACEDILVIGADGDPQKADAVLEQTWMTASELWSMADQKIFRSAAVEEVVRGGKDILIGNDQTSNIKQQQIVQGGRSRLNREIEQDRYKIIEAYLKVDVDGSGITSDVIVWIHARSRKILRATYLRRIMPSGKRPYFRIAFHKRHGVEYSVGLVELLYSLGKEIDAMHNINVDIGILSSLPFGFYRPTTASLKEESLPIEPGALIPVDNPQADIYFPNLGVRTSFGFQEHQALMSQIERLTSISDLNLGVIGAQGATRTATGTRALLGESSNNLNIFISRMNRGWKRALRYMFEMLQQRIPPGFQFRVLGDDGNAYWRQIESKQELCGMYDFELDANSANSNKQVQIEQANLIVQSTANPIDLQLGIVTKENRYEALLHNLKVNGVKDVAKFLTKPQGAFLSLSPLEMADRLLSGVDVELNPQMDLQGFITIAQHFHDEEELNGQFGPHQLGVLMHKAQEAQLMLQALQQAQGQANVAQQQNMNTQASMIPSNMQPAQITQQPQPGQGG